MANLLLAVIYLAFISLGLPDSLLGSAWPSMYPLFNVPLSYAGIISLIIAFGTIVSSLLSDRLTRRFGAGRVTAVSVMTTALALLGFSLCRSFLPLCLLALPYGLGAGGVDAALNNYVAVHYESRHMNWLHCMWGIGASTGPYIMAYAIGLGRGWTGGYRSISIIQLLLSAMLIFTLPLWKGRKSDPGESSSAPMSFAQIFKIRGVPYVLLAFFCYCALEQTAMLWGSSYLVLHGGISPEEAAGFAGLFCLGLTFGRGLSGFISMKLSDSKMILSGMTVILLGLALIFIGRGLTLAGLVLTGLGCAPIYPSIIHSTPAFFGADKSQAIIGIQMAGAYVGILLMPPLFGLIAQHISVSLFPLYLLILLIVMFLSYRRLLKSVK